MIRDILSRLKCVGTTVLQLVFDVHATLLYHTFGLQRAWMSSEVGMWKVSKHMFTDNGM